MAEESDLSFGKVAIEKGFISSKQLDEAVEVLQAVRKLGLKEDLGSILVKKKYLSPEQAKEIRQLQGQREGVRIANYEILEKIGQGGMGAVFKARQISLDRVVALKILIPKLAADKSFTERFIREAQAVAKLSHPNIIVGIDVGQAGKYFYFAMEYVEGQTALEILREEERFKEADALKIAQQIARALDHAHKNGLVHRDIKPDNIMVTVKGDAKLCDLGLAKRLDIGDNLQPGTAVGTPHYIAPEQARGRDDVDIRADIYALGASLYHMTTGRTMFHGETAAAIMTQHLSSEAPNAKKIRPELSEPFCRLLERMLAKNPEDRYQTPQELLEDIDRLIAGKPLKGMLKPDVPCSMERTARRPRGPGQLASRGTTGPRTPIGPPDPTTGPRTPVESRPTGMLFIGAGIGVLLLAGVGAFLALRSSATPAPSDGPAAAAQTPADKTPVQPEPVKPAVAVNAPAPPPKPAWPPLDAARQARQTQPDDLIRLIGLFETAEKGAPKEILVEIYREKKELMDRLMAAIDRKVEAQWELAQTCFNAHDYAGALACFAPEKAPQDLACEETAKRWEKRLKDLQQEIWLEFHRKLEPELAQEIRKATEAPQLDDLRKRLKEIVAKMPVEGVQNGVAALEKALEGRARQILAAKQREQLETFKRVLTSAKQIAANGDTTAFAKAADQIELQRPLLAESFRPIADQFARDLRAVQGIYEKSWEVLTAKGEARESVPLYIPAGAQERTTLKLNGKAGVDGVWYKGGANKEDRLPFAKLDDRDVLEMAGITEATEDGRKKLGTFFFWKNNPGRAYELLAPFRKEQTFGLYLVWMDMQARQMIGDVEELYRQVTTLKLSSIERERRRRQAEKLVMELKNEYGATEVYRERALSK